MVQITPLDSEFWIETLKENGSGIRNEVMQFLFDDFLMAEPLNRAVGVDKNNPDDLLAFGKLFTGSFL